MATNEEIRNYLLKTRRFKPKNFQIAHAKEICGIPLKKSHNRTGPRKWKCSEPRLKDIKEAFLHFGMIKE